MRTQNNGVVRYMLSLLADQALAIMAAALISNFFRFFSDDGFPLITQLLSIGILFLVFYVDSWKHGCSDGSRIRLGRLKKNYFRGVLAGLAATLPGLVLATGAFLAESNIMRFYELFDNLDIFTALYRVWSYPLGGFFGFINELPVLNFALLFFMPLVSGLGYVLGLHEITLKSIFVYKNVDEEDDDE